MICNRVGMTEEELNQIFVDLDFGKKDSLTIDMTSGTPAPMRKDIFEKIEFETQPNVHTKEKTHKKHK